MNLEEKARLIEVYEPTLILQTTDRPPIDPAEYIRRAGLWTDGDPQTPSKDAWGELAGNVRRAEFAPGKLSVDGEEEETTALDDAMASLQESPGLFLGHGGWQEEWPAPEVTPVPTPLAGLVTEETTHGMAFVDYAERVWRLPDPVSELAGSIPWYTAQVHDWTSLTQALAQPGSEAFNILFQVFQALGQDTWFIWYDFFYPFHWDTIPICEMIALMYELGVEIPDDPFLWQGAVVPGAEHDSAGTLEKLVQALMQTGAPFALPFASYLGDFTSVCVVAPAPTEGTGGPVLSPLDIPLDDFAPPLFVTYGGKASVLVELDTAEGPKHRPQTVPLMQAVPGDSVELDGNHPRVYVARGTHNNYPTGGARNRRRDPTTATVCEVLDIPEDAPVPNTGEHKRRNAAAAMVAKALAGAAVGGVFGALAGLAAGLAEGLRDTDPEAVHDALDEEDEQQDEAPHAPDGALVLTAAPLVGEPFEDAVDPFDPAGGTIETVFPWSGTFEQKVIDSEAPPPWFTEGRLRFGPPCLDDPFRRRGGKARTDFKEETILALARHLGQPGE